MADYTKSKDGLGAIYPLGAIDTSWGRVGPLISPSKVKTLHLIGLPLVSKTKNPNTGKFDEITEEHIKVFIEEAVTLTEAEVGIIIMPTQIKEKQPMDKAEYDSYGYFQLRQRPISSLEELSVVPINADPIFTIPAAWISTGYLHRGQINIIPLTLAVSSVYTINSTTTPGSAAFLSLFGKHWVPAFWDVTYTAGFADGRIPDILNELIGVVAAMEILSALATTYARATSQSLSIDGLSESSSTPGPDLYETRIGYLAGKRKMLVGKCKAAFGVKFPVGNV